VRLLGVLRRQWLVVLVCLLLVPLAALGASLVQTPEYESTASLLFRDPGFDEKLFGTGVLLPSDDAAREAATNLELVSLRVIREQTAAALPVGMSADDIERAVAVTQEGGSNLVTIAARDPDAQTAAMIANTFAKEYIEYRRTADRQKIREAIELVGGRLDVLGADDPRTRSLRQRLDELEVLESLQTGNAEVADTAQASRTPVTPRPLRNTLFGVVLGGMLGVALAFLRDQLDRRIRSAEEASELLGRPLLGMVPEMVGAQARQLAAGRLPLDRLETFRLLRAGLLFFNVDRRIRSVLVTSPAPGDGKSTTVWNLAAAAASAGDRVLVIEADLRRPALADRHGIDSSGVGLAGVLAGNATFERSVVVVDDVVHSHAHGVRSGVLHVLPAGGRPPNPTDLLESRRMQDLLKSAETLYDLVIVDTPPASIVSDAIPLLGAVSGVIVVVRLGTSTRDALRNLRRTLDNAAAPTLGVVANAVPRSDAGYGDAYAYGYSAGDAPPPPPSRGAPDAPDAPERELGARA
jgi:receptor protein-tyrosine kinase